MRFSAVDRGRHHADVVQTVRGHHGRSRDCRATSLLTGIARERKSVPEKIRARDSEEGGGCAKPCILRYDIVRELAYLSALIKFAASTRLSVRESCWRAGGECGHAERWSQLTDYFHETHAHGHSRPVRGYPNQPQPRSERSSCANSRETHRGAFARTRRHGPPSASTWDVSGSSCESDATVPSPPFSRSAHAQCATSRGAASSGAPGRIVSVPCPPSRPRGDRRDDGHVTSDRKSTTILRGRVGSIRATGGTSGGASARNRGASGAAVQWRERGG